MLFIHQRKNHSNSDINCRTLKNIAFFSIFLFSSSFFQMIWLAHWINLVCVVCFDEMKRNERKKRAHKQKTRRSQAKTKSRQTQKNYFQIVSGRKGTSLMLIVAYIVILLNARSWGQNRWIRQTWGTHAYTFDAVALNHFIFFSRR